MKILISLQVKGLHNTGKLLYDPNPLAMIFGRSKFLQNITAQSTGGAICINHKVLKLTDNNSVRLG